MEVRKFGDFKYGFSENNIEKLKMAGITPSDVQGIIKAGRSRGVSDEGIWQAINNQYKSFAEKYNAEQQANKDKYNKGAAFYALEQIPVIGTWTDEAAARIAAIGDKSYEEAHKEIEEARDYTKKQFKENAEQGNWLTRNVLRYTPEAANIANNALLATATGGATLMPGVSGLQGALEGAGMGNDVGERTANAIFSGGISYAIPAAFNKFLPTKGVQQQTINQLASQTDDMSKAVFAKALKYGTTPEEVISKTIPKGMRPDLWSNIRRNAVGEDVFRGALQKSASRVVSQPYEEYVEGALKKVVKPDLAKKLGETIQKARLDELGDDIVGVYDPRQIVMDAVNKVMKKAPTAQKELVGQTMSDAIARRGVAKKLTTATVKKPISTASGSIMSILRRANAPLRNLSNLGTMRTMTTNTLLPEWLRGGLDAAIEAQQFGSLK